MRRSYASPGRFATQPGARVAPLVVRDLGRNVHVVAMVATNLTALAIYRFTGGFAALVGSRPVGLVGGWMVMRFAPPRKRAAAGAAA